MCVHRSRRLSVVCVFLKVGFVCASAASAQLSGEVWLAPAPTLPVDYQETRLELEATRGGLSVDGQNRSAVRSFFDLHYTPNLSVPMGWTGSIAGCVAGVTSAAYLDATIDMINYFRAMVGLPSVINQVPDNAGAQDAALMMIAEGALSHAPPMSWACYTSAGAASAASSNLALGNAGPAAMVAYIRDSGTFNEPVGHRRWILYPRRTAMGSGSNDGVNVFHHANALDVFGPTGSPLATPVAVPWPPAGFVPYQVVYPRWSFSLNTVPNANYSSATVSMSQNGSPVTLTVLAIENGFGDNTIVWEPSGLVFGGGMEDATFTVTVDNIQNSAVSQFTYDVTVIDPAVAVDDLFADGFESGTVAAWTSSTP